MTVPLGMDREAALLNEAAHALDQFAVGDTAYSTRWMSENLVASSEIHQIAAAIAVIIRGYLALPLKEQNALLSLSQEGTPE